MGPLDPIPPMVTAGGMPNTPIDQSAQLAELLRRKAAAQKQAQMATGNAEMWNNTIGQPHFTQTVRGGGNAPDQVVVNYGDILGKGISNYMGAKERKTAIDKNDEVNQISQEFMQHTLSTDPQAVKLYGLSQAGVPGADKALATHLEPKKQSMAVLVQGLTSGMMDPEMASQLAPQYGLDPEIVRKAAVYAAKTAEEKRAGAFADKSALLNQNIEGQKELQNNKPTKTGYTQAELNAMPIEQRIAAVQASTGRETAESKARGKMKVEAEQDVPKTDRAIKYIQDVINFADKAAYYPGTGGLVDPALTPNNKNNTMLVQAIDQLTLDAAGGKLGAGVSNADREFFKSAAVMLNKGNRDTVVAQLNRKLSDLIAHRAQQAKLAGLDVPQQTMNGPSSPVDYSSSKSLRPAPSFDDVWKEVGGE